MQRIGSRAQVMHGNAKMTGGGLKKRDLKYNKQGKIVSKKMSILAKKEKRLQKAGYTTVKGQFGAVRRMKGGAGAAPSTPTGQEPIAFCADDRWLQIFSKTQEAVTKMTTKIGPLTEYELFTRGNVSFDNPFNAVYISERDVIKVGLKSASERNMTRELDAYKHLNKNITNLNNKNIFFPELLDHGEIEGTDYMFIQIKYIKDLIMVVDEDTIKSVKDKLERIGIEHGDLQQNVYQKGENFFIIDFEASSINEPNMMNSPSSCNRGHFSFEELPVGSPQSPYLGGRGRRIMYMSSPNSPAEVVTLSTPVPAPAPGTPEPAPGTPDPPTQRSLFGGHKKRKSKKQKK